MSQQLGEKDLRGIGILTKLGQTLIAKDDRYVCDFLHATYYAHTTAQMRITSRNNGGLDICASVFVRADKSFEITIDGTAKSRQTKFSSVLDAVENILWRRDMKTRLVSIHVMAQNLADQYLDTEDLDVLISAFARCEDKRQRALAAASAQPQVQGSQGD